MQRFIPAFAIVCATLGASSSQINADEATANWPAWRGADGSGVAANADPPITWSETENIRWKVPIPGKGHSTPIVWGNKIFVTTAIPVGPTFDPLPETAPGAHDNAPVTQRLKFAVIAIDRSNGKTIWQRDLHEAVPHEGAHFSGSHASQSPITDGKHIWAFFGSYGLYCLDIDGNPRWDVQLGTMNTKHGHGEGISPVLHGNILVVNWDHEGASFITARNKETGKEIWRGDREEVTSWSTPLVVVHEGKAQLIVCGTEKVRSYDLQNGSIIWECGGLSHNIVASPVATNGLVIVGSSYEKRAMFAIKLDGATGDITDTDQVVWSRSERTPYVPSPLLYQDSLYFLRHYQGILTRVDALTGEERTGPFRLGRLRDIYASPVGAANKIFFTDLDGATLVLSTGEIPRFISVNQLDDSFSASPAIAGNEIFLRGKQFLYCIAKDTE